MANFGGFRNSLRIKGIPFIDSDTNKNETRICCPFCVDLGESPDSKFRLGINTRTGQSQCFNCGWKSRFGPQAVIRKLQLQPVHVAQEEEEEEKAKFEMPQGLISLAKHWKDSRWSKLAYKYLLERGMDLTSIIHKNVLFTERGRFAYRVTFPVYIKDEIVGLVGRSIVKDQEPRYLNTPGLRAIWNIRKRPMKTVMLCEGIFKAIKLEGLYYDEMTVAAVLGHSITQPQIDQLKRVEKVILWPDPDPVGLKGAIKIAYKLQSQFQIALPGIIPTKQADEMGGAEIEKVFRSVELLSDSLKNKYEFAAMKRRDDA